MPLPDYSSITRRIPDATVMFISIHNFPRLIKDLTQTELNERVQYANLIYGIMDMICEQQNVEKLKAVGSKFIVSGI